MRAVLATAEPSRNRPHIFAGTRANGLFKASGITPAVPSTWGRLKDRYR